MNSGIIDQEKLIKKTKNIIDSLMIEVNRYGSGEVVEEIRKALEDHLTLLNNKEKEILSLQALIEAERAVKDRFKELYVDVVVKNALEETKNEET